MDALAYVFEVDKPLGARCCQYFESVLFMALYAAIGGISDLRRDLPEPPHPNHVGQVFNILSSRGIIERTGWGTSTCRARKHGVRSVWVLHRQHRQPEPRRFKAGEHLARLLTIRQTTRSTR